MTSSASKKFLVLIAAAGLVLAAVFFSRDAKKQSPSAVSVTRTESGSVQAQASSTPPAFRPAAFSSETQSKLQLLDQILASRNDNDPRMDRELRNLSPETKTALVEKYRSLAREDRNGRGTIVFLIGREMTSPADAEFMREALQEPPCLSLDNCSKEMKTATGEEAHQDTGIETTLAYPQLVALHSLEQALEHESSAPLQEASVRAIRAGMESPIPSVARKASELNARAEARGNR